MRVREPGRERLFLQSLQSMHSVEEHFWEEQGRISLCWWYKHSSRFPSGTDSLQQTKHWQSSLSSFSSLQWGSVVILSPTSRTLWGAVRSLSTHFQCACLRGTFLMWSMRKSRLSFQFVFKITCKNCVRNTVMVATIFKVSISYYLTQILSSLMRHLFHPFWFIQINPYSICHKLFQPPIEIQFQEFPLTLTTTTICVLLKQLLPHKTLMKGATLLFSNKEVQIF